MICLYYKNITKQYFNMLHPPTKEQKEILADQYRDLFELDSDPIIEGFRVLVNIFRIF